jgi:hypothetical protein
LGFLVVLTVWLLWGTELRWESGCLMTTLKETSWPNHTYARWGGTTFGHAINLSPTADAETLRHELVHVGQVEGICVASLVPAIAIFVAGCPLTALGVSSVSWLAAIGGAGLAAWLSGENPYAGSHLEKAAYARERPAT